MDLTNKKMTAIPDTAASIFRHRGSFWASRPRRPQQAGERGEIVLRFRPGRHVAATGNDDGAGGYGIGQNGTGHAVCRGGIKAVAGEKCTGVPSVTMLPSKNRAQRWVCSAQNSTSWLTINTVTPRRSKVFMIPANVCLNAASRPLVGSSISRISGSSNKTFARAARCCSPPERS